MRHINALGPEKVPRDDEFHFRDRAKVLVDKWHEMLNASKTHEAPPAKVPSPNGTKANGTGKKSKKEPVVKDGEKKEEDSMDVDADATKEETTPPAAESEKADDVQQPNDDHADEQGVGDESVLADVTMSEAA